MSRQALLIVHFILSVLLVVVIVAMLPTWLKTIGWAAALVQNSYDRARLDAGSVKP